MCAVVLCLSCAACAGRAVAAGNILVTYQAGWNLVAGSGVPIDAGDGPIYYLPAASPDYEVLPQGNVLAVESGYWIYFDQTTQIAIPDGGSTTGVPLPAGQWVMVGRPAFAGPEVRGADLVYAYDPVAEKYVRTYSLAPGQGALALSYAGGVFDLSYPGAPAP